MHAIMVEGDGHRLARGEDGAGLRFGRGDIMLHRFGNAEIHEADAHAGGKQHGEPGHIGKVGFRIVGTEPQPAGRTKSQHQNDHHEGRHRSDVEPAERIDRPTLRRLEQKVGRAGRDQRARQHQRDDRRCAPEYARVHGGFHSLVLTGMRRNISCAGARHPYQP